MVGSYWYIVYLHTTQIQHIVSGLPNFLIKIIVILNSRLPVGIFIVSIFVIIWIEIKRIQIRLYDSSMQYIAVALTITILSLT